jgi:hypothetical protein
MIASTLRAALPGANVAAVVDAICRGRPPVPRNATSGTTLALFVGMLGIRWTIGDVSPRGFEALRLSIWGAWRIFGADADYCVCVNTVSVDRARVLVGPVPDEVEWLAADELLPGWLRARFLDAGLAEGVAWKLAPLRCFPAARELSLDNNVILGDVPAGLAARLGDESPERCLLAEDMAPALGQFDSLCENRALSSGMRGLPAGFDLERRLLAVLDVHPVTLRSELDEQGLQAAALLRDIDPRPAPRAGPHVMSVEDAAICTPFPPHLPRPEVCGAHLAGLDASRVGWDFEGEPAERVRARHRDQHRAELYQRVGIEPELSELSMQGG